MTGYLMYVVVDDQVPLTNFSGFGQELTPCSGGGVSL
jgi:hypothetical protein